MRETWVPSLGREDPLEKEMAIHSSTIAWKIPWTEEPGRLQSMGSQRVGHDWATSLSFPFTFAFVRLGFHWAWSCHLVAIRYYCTSKNTGSPTSSLESWIRRTERETTSWSYDSLKKWGRWSLESPAKWVTQHEKDCLMENWLLVHF